ncbi:MAG: adenylyltransferase/cytidyltransferase family protein [Acidobacteriota bacterium]|nr:adenylyltransferase/cytidyltransferase family protein [Acidobacteriota bacterium]
MKRSTSEKVLDRATLQRRLTSLRESGKTIAFANGLFDILHVGHLRYLRGAAEVADILVVAVNADRSARELKGPGRPVTPQHERAELIAGFDCTDFVTIFDELTVEPLLRALRPDFHCKGTDYTAENVPEAAIAKELGIEVAIVGDPKDHATREIIERLSTPDDS